MTRTNKKKRSMVVFLFLMISISSINAHYNSKLLYHNLDIDNEDSKFPFYLETSSWKENGTLICSLNGSQGNPQLVSDGTNGAIIVWEDYRNISNTDIYAQRINSNGDIMWGDDDIKVCTAIEPQYTPQICSDESGGAIIIWRDTRDFGGGDIYAQRINSSGHTQWTYNGVNISTGSGTKGWHQIVSDGAGGAVMVWQDSRSGTYKIYAQYINSTGDAQWMDNGLLICTDSGSQDNPQLIMDNNNSTIFAWSTLGDIYAQRVNSSGILQWDSDGVAISVLSGNQMNAQLVSDGAGGAIITWQDDREGPDTHVYAQRIDSSGIIQWFLNGIIISNEIDRQAEPKISSDGLGGAIITWMDRRNGIYNIFAQRINSTGHTQWTDNGTAICIAGNDQNYPKVISDGDKGAIIVWMDGDIKTQYIYSNGNTNWTDNGIYICNANGSQGNPQLISDGSNGVIFVWQDSRSGLSKIYSNQILLNPQQLTLTSTAEDPDPDGNFWLNWTVSSNADNYTLYQNGIIVDQGLTNYSYYITDLSTGTYNYTVIAFNEYGNTTSNVIQIEVELNPQQLTLTSTAEDPDPDGNFWLNWTVSSNADNYTLYQNGIIVDQGLTNYSYYITDLSTGTYNYTVIAFNEYGNTTSNVIQIEVLEEQNIKIIGYDLAILIGVGVLIVFISVKRGLNSKKIKQIHKNIS